MDKPIKNQVRVRDRQRSGFQAQSVEKTIADRNGCVVGYGCPPKSGRFKPGQSGNPKGRPKGSKNTATILQEELNSRVPIRENGKLRNIPKRRAAIKQQVNKAAAGNDRAFKQVFDMERAQQSVEEERKARHGFNPSENSETLAQEDQQILLDSFDKLSIKHLQNIRDDQDE